jgi:ribose transport system ATP-binding protein
VSELLPNIKVLGVQGLTKRYPGVIALDHVDLDVTSGEVHVLVGENGAGKSTLVKCLAGVEQADAGEMQLAGESYRPPSAAAALRAGVRVVHQELSLLSALTVAENLSLERLPSRAGIVDRAAMRRRASELLERVGLDMSPDTPTERLGVAQMQLVEIARAVGGECRLLVMDEPTATLTSREVDTLFTLLRQLTGQGVAVVYISHHLAEIFEIGDRVTVLRNGRHVRTAAVADVDSAQLVKMMVGRDLHTEFPPVAPRAVGRELLRVTDLKVSPASSPISLSGRAGELVGIAGLVGSGRTEVMRAVFGADRASSGQVHVRDRLLRPGRPSDAVRSGISFLTEDRKAQGLLLDLSIADNVTLADLSKISRAGLLQLRTEQRNVRDAMARVRMRATGPRQIVRTLSGGNQQKVVLARWLLATTDVLIVDEPTRGIDVGARYEIHQLLLDLAAAGKGLLVVSSDLHELLGICDRLIVFSRGRVAGEIARRDFDPERVLQLAYSGYFSDGLSA